MHTLRFVTGNEGKVEEAREYLEGLATVEQVGYDYTEIQHDDLAAIARRGARESYDAIAAEDQEIDGVLVDDTGLFVDALDGFPGPYSAYVEGTVGVERVWELASAEENRRAHFRTVLAYADENGVEIFEGSVAGTLVEPRGEGGFGYDPIFAYNGQTLAEMTAAEKNAISHRGRALAAFADWYAERTEETADD
ncbi:RdgB/HAM1 family non-canonical purine NTP pyrophosphatase [Halobacteria archaeon AArc-curdl1]|uniref:RdgB/HAM1 family non-canonical purine NTP pyrophosphatase n=1 Tax=Natronosalvus hydrolyticus TaxID=2979988 RepID=A0AAP2ZB58_9EURY|nr:RdgB/HAM1 family non-canonical purine NTP pyrophosphatase [Halobacteria archaeon AArc-curdl1]